MRTLMVLLLMLVAGTLGAQPGNLQPIDYDAQEVDPNISPLTYVAFFAMLWAILAKDGPLKDVSNKHPWSMIAALFAVPLIVQAVFG